MFFCNKKTVSTVAGLRMPVSENGNFNRFTRKSIKMDVATKKKIEEQLRQLILKAETDPDQDSGFGTSRSRGVQVIRRRKRSVGQRVA